MAEFTFVSENKNFGIPSPSTAPPPTAVPPPAQYKKIKFGAYEPGHSKNALNARSLASDVRLAQLKVSDAQRVLIESMYAINASNSFIMPPIVDHIFSMDSNGQLQASAVLAQHSLDVGARDDLGNRWSMQWSERGKEDANIKRVLYLCSCGYDHTKRNTKYDRQQHQDYVGSREATIRFHSPAALLMPKSHCQLFECKDALFTRIPPITIHPSVYAVALSQLRDGATFNDVRKKKNRELFRARAYKDFPTDLHTSPFRWLLEHKDSCSLYRQYNRMKGIDVTDAPQVNVDEWLDPTLDKFNPTLAHAIFHYSRRAEKGDRFEACIATDEMNAAAWKYGHDSQIILDGTFGVCDSRVLLFIVMAVDENRKGVPVAFLLFSAPTGNKQSSAGYNTSIIAKLVGKWKESLNKYTDLKERAALILVFPDIWLLICRFHLRQSWRNHRNKLLKGKRQLHVDLKHRMIRLEKALTATQAIFEARDLLQAERQVMEKLWADHPRAAALALDTTPITYSIRIGFNGAVSCDCPDFRDRGGACKHIRGALIVLDDLRHRMYIPPIPIPRSLSEAQALQAQVILTITTRPKQSELPTSRAAEKIEDILGADDSCLDGNKLDDDETAEDDDDNASVATDASSDSDSDSEDSPVPSAPRATQSAVALKEQILARTLFELREVGFKLSDLGDHLQQSQITHLSDEHREEVGIGSGWLRHFLTQLGKLLDLPNNPPPASQQTSAPPVASSSAPSLKRKAANQLLPPSPEKLQRRHPSFAPH
ncbi:hypothetical protein DFH09DRAFT_1314736 [Mycena vulgaris]|nr:hypothetical protein DFH09DRAFT_1314736 [Mycena vulgaris]